jgi:hypothetical protein
MLQYMPSTTKLFVPLFFTITLAIIGADLYFLYSSDDCLNQHIIFQSITLHTLLQRNIFLNLIGLTMIGFAIKNNYPFLLKSMTRSMMVLYDVTSFLLSIVLIYNYIGYNNCSGNLSKYILARMSGSIFTLVKGIYKNN